MLDFVKRAWALGTREHPRGFVAEWTLTALIVLFGSTTVLQAFVVPTGSMESNILVGDHVIVDKVAYADSGPVGKFLLPYREIQRGDIIVFIFPEDPRQAYVKRVIGVPGDRIRIENKQVIRNGKKLLEPYAQHIAESYDAYRDNFPSGTSFNLSPLGRQMLNSNLVNEEIVVPPGNYFAMGDNRDNSLDSRFWGFVPRANIVGRPVIVYWSIAADTNQLLDRSVDGWINMAKNIFTKSRWDRIGLIPRTKTAQEVPLQ